MTNIINDYSITPGDIPLASEIDLGSIAIQAADGHIYLKKTDGAVVRVTMLPGGDTQQVLYKTGSGDYALGWGTISSTVLGSTLWAEVVAEVQRVFDLVEGTASVLLSAPATLPAGSTGPLTVSVADSSYLTAGTSIKGLLGTVYGVLARAADGSYSFTSEQSYTGSVTLGAGTRFAAAHTGAVLPNQINPLLIGESLQSFSQIYVEKYYYALTDANGSIAFAILPDGSFYAPKYTGNFTGNLIGTTQAEHIDALSVTTQALNAPGGSIDLDSVNTQNLEIGPIYQAKEQNIFLDRYTSVTVDGQGRFVEAILPDGTCYTVKAKVKQLSADNITSPTLDASYDVSAHGSFGVVTAEGGPSASQLYHYRNGIRTALTSGDIALNPVVTSESPQRVLFVQSGERKVIDPLTQETYPFTSSRDVHLWSDSMLQNVEGGSGRLAAGFNSAGVSMANRVIRDFSIGTQSSLQVALRMDAIPLTATVSGGQIPSSGSVEILDAKTPIMSAVFAEDPAYTSPYGENPLKTGGWISTFADANQVRNYVEIQGVKGSLIKTNSRYYFERFTAGNAVAVPNSATIRFVGADAAGSADEVALQDNAQTTWILWPNGPHTGQVEKAAEIEIQVIDSILSRARTVDKKILLLYRFEIYPAYTGSTFVQMRDLLHLMYKENFSELYYDFSPDFLTGLPAYGLPDYKTWLQTNYPTLYADPAKGWNAELATHPTGPVNTPTETAAVASVSLSANGGSGVTTQTSVDTVTVNPSTLWYEQGYYKKGLRVGVEASNGVATSLWVREGGRGYASGDTFTIPAGTIGNTQDIAGTVSAVQSETLGTVRNLDGSVDVANSFSQWDWENGYIPRCSRIDDIHPGAFSGGSSAEYLSLLLGYYFKSRGWE